MPHGRHKPVLALTSETARLYIALVKWRNQMLALFCLFLFFAFGVFYFKYWVIQKPFGIILFIGEGLDAQQLAAARLRAGGADKPLALESLRYAGLLKNYSSGSATPDPAAAATALSTGVKVNNGSLAIDVDGNELTTVLELARENGRLAGLVTNGTVTSPTSAAFYAHTLAKDDRAEIARQLAKAKLDLVLGGGLADFAHSEGEEGRNDRELLGDLVQAGYEVVHSLEELEDVPRWRRPKLAGFFADGDLPFAGDVGAQDEQPTLAVMVRRAIELLQYHRGGYLLVVDAALPRKAALENNAAQRVAETVELDHAISEALRYAGAKSLILVCGDVAIQSIDAPAARENGSNRPAAEAGAEPVTPPPGSPPGDDQQPPVIIPEAEPAATLAEPGASPTPNEESSRDPAPVAPPKPGDETAEDVLAFGTGLGANALHGVAESTVIFDMIRDNL
jgi:alkaline phosphatase